MTKTENLPPFFLLLLPIMRALDYSKIHEIPISLNCNDIADNELEKYQIEDISLTFPKVFKSIVEPYLDIYVSED